MTVLLDTHVLLWAAGEPERLSGAATALLQDRANQLLFSAASLWEIVIKLGLGRPDFEVDPSLLRRGLLANGYGELPVTGAHVLEVAQLAAIHRDPFDRVLLAQARVESCMLATADATLGRYGYPVLLV